VALAALAYPQPASQSSLAVLPELAKCLPMYANYLKFK
jgi:hypothetical protein